MSPLQFVRMVYTGLMPNFHEGISKLNRRLQSPNQLVLLRSKFNGATLLYLVNWSRLRPRHQVAAVV